MIVLRHQLGVSYLDSTVFEVFGQVIVILGYSRERPFGFGTGDPVGQTASARGLLTAVIRIMHKMPNIESGCAASSLDSELIRSAPSRLPSTSLLPLFCFRVGDRLPLFERCSRG